VVGFPIHWTPGDPADRSFTAEPVTLGRFGRSPRFSGRYYVTTCLLLGNCPFLPSRLVKVARP
jgi:hypothetical protein